MIEPVGSEQVMVKRRQDGAPFAAKTRNYVYLDLTDRAGNVTGRGALIGIEIEDDRGFRMYCMPEHIQ